MTMAAKANSWRDGASVALPLVRSYSDQAIFERLALSLQINRHVAEFWSDEIVSQELWRLRNLPMPWSSDNE